MSEIKIPLIIIGLGITFIGSWLMIAPRKSKIGIFLGPMIFFRFFGILLILFGIFAFVVGIGLRKIGPIPIIVR
ncbi:MAG: hypothetical protein APR63_06585 [Desulfuromonas sp. SDB]|nr:MAG: hypothetical protein APR63_06585 [Desulfuromonas sp. SDB]